MDLPYQASALQDRFVVQLLNYKQNGFYMDIGSCSAISCNNTYALESLGWKGVCVEIDPQHTESYKERTCQHINEDATTIDYAKMMEAFGYPEVIDYLSLDIDELSTTVLKVLPLDKYKFRIITVEHDHYLNGDVYKDEQREILIAAGYTLVCSDVLVPIQHDTTEGCSFEDWWVNYETVPGNISIEMLRRVTCKEAYPIDIIAKFK